MEGPQADAQEAFPLTVPSNLMNEGGLGPPIAVSNPEHGVMSPGRQKTTLEFVIDQSSLMDSLSSRQPENDSFSSQPSMVENISSLSGMASLSSREPTFETQSTLTHNLMSQQSDINNQSPTVMYAVVSQSSVANNFKSPVIDSVSSLPMAANTLPPSPAVAVEITKDNSLTEARIPLFKSIDSLVFYVPASMAVLSENGVGNESAVGTVDNGGHIPLNKNEGSPRSESPSSYTSKSLEINKQNSALETNSISSKQALRGSAESMEYRLARRNALLPPRRRRRLAPKAIFSCSGCGRIFKNSFEQNKHLAVCKRAKDLCATEENRDHSSHVCPMCLMDFPRALLLQDHMNFVHNKKRPISCPRCPKKFYRPHDLKIHLNIHFNIKNYICDTCGRQFHHISNLKRHQRTHSGVRPYACEYCQKRFTQVITLRMHLKRHIKNGVALSIPSNHVRRFYCHICGKTFKTKAERVSHENVTHSGKDEVQCKTCNQAFDSTGDLKNHTCNRRSCRIFKKAFTKKQSSDDSTAEDFDGVSLRTLPKKGFSIPSVLPGSESSIELSNSTFSQPDEGSCNLVRENAAELNMSVVPSEMSSTDTLVVYVSENGNHLSYVVRKEPAATNDGNCSDKPSDTIAIDMLPGAPRESTIIDDLADANLKEMSGPDSTEKSSVCRENLDSELPAEYIKVEVTENETLSDHVCFNDEVLVHTVISDPLLDDSRSPKSEGSDDLAHSTHSGFNMEPDSVFLPSHRQPLGVLNTHFCSSNAGSTNLSSSVCARESSENSRQWPRLNSQKASTVAEFRSVQLSSPINSQCDSFSLDSSDAAGEIPDILADSSLQDSLKFPESVQFSPPRNTTSVLGVQKYFKNNIPKEKKSSTKTLSTDSLSFVTEKDKALAKNKDLSSNRPLFRCQVCSKVFNRKWNLKQHEGLHNPGQQRYRCPHCHRSFAYKTTYTTHLRSHSDDAGHVVCSLCSREFKSKGAMAAHTRRVHQKLRPHTCRLCDRSFHQRTELAYHLRLHSKEQPYVCFSCGKTFAHSSNLLRHERQHSGERPYRCVYCSRGFIQAVGLKRHLKKHHLNEQSQQQGLKNEDSGSIFDHSSKPISPKSFQSSDQFSLKLPMCESLKGAALTTPSLVCEEPPVSNLTSSNNADVPKCSLEVLDSISKTKLLNVSGNVHVDAEPDMFAVMAGDASDGSIMQEGDKSILRQVAETAVQGVFNADIPDNVISNIGDVYGIIFMQ